MATVTLGSKAEGSIVKLKENGVLVDFYIAKHNYESGLNGSGRVLVVRKDCYDTRQWHSSNVNAYAASAIDSWLNGTYKNLLDVNIRNQMGETTFYYTPGGGNNTKTTLKRAVFLLSSTELGYTNPDLNTEGTALSSTVVNLLRIAKLNGNAVVQWNRSPVTYYAYYAWVSDSTGILSSSNCTATLGSRPAFTLPSNLYVRDDGSVSVNTAPTTPGSITVPSDISGGTTITISWAASSDDEGNLAGYIVEKSIDGGSQWTQIYRSQSTATSAQDNVVFGTDTVIYRVKAFDTGGLESGWRTSDQVTVVNNTAPDAPSSITVPMTVIGGADLAISWSAAVDSDGNLSGYELERQVDGQSWEQIYRGDKMAFTDSITKGWETVAYRVRAYDDLNAVGPYTTSKTRTVNNNTAPVVICDTPSGDDLGVKSEGFTVGYSVSDADADAVTITEAIDGASLRTFQAELGRNYTFEVTGNTFMRVLNGRHTLSVTACDGQASTVHSLTFTKEVTEASITLKEAFSADAKISICVLFVAGDIPADAEYKVEVTNNADDDTPVWEDCTVEVKNGGNHIFTNETAIKGFAFNFRVTVKRGLSGQGGYINSVQGGFQ